MKKVKPELLAPAGNLDILKIAFLYGADAVYCSTPDFAMRSRVGFTLETLKEGIEYAHKIGKKIYVTVNVFPHSSQISELEKHLSKVAELKPDALIVADPGLVAYIKQNFDIPIHLSTQANTTNHLAAEFWKKQGVERIVTARELSLEDIIGIKKKVNVELEVFIHGAMCMAYSGRCQISNYLTGRDPNQGQCVQACRFKYKMYALEEDLRKEEFFPIYEDESGSHILNSKDLCMIEHVDDLIEAGVESFKIEGRLKSEYYVATVVKAYRQAIDLYLKDPKKYASAKKALFLEISKSANREFTTGFFYGKPNSETNNYASSKAKSNWGYIGRVSNYDKKTKKLTFEAKNYLPIGASLEIITPTEIFKIRPTEMFVQGKKNETAHANNIVNILTNQEIDKNALIRINMASILDKSGRNC